MTKGKKTQRRPQNSGYSEAGASWSRRALKAFVPNSSSPSEDIDWNNMTLRQRSRMLYMSTPIAASAINTNRTKVIGVGMTMKPSVDRSILGLSPEAAKEWQRKTEAEFNLWAGKKQNCDALGINSFKNMQQLGLKSWLMNGDAFALIQRVSPTPLNPYSLRIHLIEADRVCTPDGDKNGMNAYGITDGVVRDGQPGAGNRIYDGVEVDGSGMITAYHVCSGYPMAARRGVLTWTRVLAYGRKSGLPNILHIMESERAEQYRGVPYISVIIEPLLQIRRFTESELVAALVQSFFTAWIETQTNPADIPMNEVGAGDFEGIPSSDPDTDNISRSENEYEMGPGTVLHLSEGETVHFGNPNIPTTGFDAFVKVICRMMGAALEIPSEVLLKEFNSSYSASRAALLEAWEAFRMRRAWFVDSFCQPIYELWLAEAVAIGRIKAPGFFDDPLVRAAWCGARWIGPVQGSLDPLKEANADIALINAGLKTREQATTERGNGDFEENAEQLQREMDLTPKITPIQPTDPQENDEGGEGNEEP